ncbi:MAG: MBL fold metallo-hydrolase [Candidatus Nanoarchaeia archaeon]|nr:MBL fold metallo-hydrolase [Candidatus Nanoarchaeia archaeon]
MLEVYVLVQGMMGEKETATTSLVLGDNFSMIVDPTVLHTKQTLIDSLRNYNLEINDVDYVFITHMHMDHIRNIGMFPDKTKIVEYYGMWEREHKNEDYLLPEGLKVVRTPGHTPNCISLLVETSKGLIGICGDVFWHKDGPEFDRFATDMETLKQSRKTLLEMCDYIIPGHGSMFNVKKINYYTLF